MPSSSRDAGQDAEKRAIAKRAVDAAFEPVHSVADAEARVRQLAHGHYENFSVVSHLVPRALRQDFCNLYGFCRVADDLGDEMGDRETSLHHLAAFRDALTACYDGRPAGAVLTALSSTIAKHAIPIEPFLDLISAFEQDQYVTEYDTFDQLLDYCRRSANPVGRLVLYLCGYRDERRQLLSDHTCTGLQLANFWQDVRRDRYDLGRIYFPKEWMKTFGVTVLDFDGERAARNFRDMVRHGVDRTEELFGMGDALIPTLSRPVAAHVGLFAQGGRAILQAIRAQDYDTLSHRPTISRWKKAKLIARVVGARAMTVVTGFGGHE